MSNFIGIIKVINISDNDDGTCTVDLEISDEFKNEVKKHYGWKRWCSKKFNKLLLEGLTKNVELMETKFNDNFGNNINRVDVFDIK